MDKEKIIRLVEKNEDTIKEHIKHMLDEPSYCDTDTRHCIRVLYDPEKDDLDFEDHLDAQGRRKNEKRTLIYEIEPGMADDTFLYIMDLENVRTGTFVSMFDLKDAKAVDYVNDLVDAEYYRFIDSLDFSDDRT